jgi:hypothetical protein
MAQLALGTRYVTVEACNPPASARGHIEITDSGLDVRRDSVPIKLRIFIDDVCWRFIGGNDGLLVVTIEFPRFALPAEIQTPSGPPSIDSLNGASAAAVHGQASAAHSSRSFFMSQTRIALPRNIPRHRVNRKATRSPLRGDWRLVPADTSYAST